MSMITHFIPEMDKNPSVRDISYITGICDTVLTIKQDGIKQFKIHCLYNVYTIQCLCCFFINLHQFSSSIYNLQIYLFTIWKLVAIYHNFL